MKKLAAIFFYPYSSQWDIDYNKGLDTDKKTVRSALAFSLAVVVVPFLIISIISLLP